MNQPNCIRYVIVENDSLYLLARKFKTTVAKILELNSGIDPYNLQVGSTLHICVGDDFVDGEKPANHDCYEQVELITKNRLAWTEHIYWTRLVLEGIANRLNGTRETEARLMRNPSDIAAIYAEFYPHEITSAIDALITEHLQIGGELITALRDNKTDDAKMLIQQWYINADKIAKELSSFNPYSDYETVRNMLYSHLELTSEEVIRYLAGDYRESIEAFDRVEEAAMMMADYFATAIMRQFPQKFF